MEKGIRIVKVLLLEYIVTAAALLLLAFLLLKFKLSNSSIRIGLTVVYVTANLVGGLFIGKIMKQKKFLWGFLVGFSYFLVVSIVSFIVNKGFYIDFNHAAIVFFLCAGGGMLGGMLS